MLRSRVSNHFSNHSKTTASLPTNIFHTKKSYSKGSWSMVFSWMILGFVCFLWFMVTHQSILVTVESNDRIVLPVANNDRTTRLPVAFDAMIQRARLQPTHCHDLGLDNPKDQQELLETNGHTSHLARFGFLRDLSQYLANKDPPKEEWDCVLPPEMECKESQFTVIFMAHNPDRLSKMINQIKIFQRDFNGLVREVVVVWNGQKQALGQSSLGQQLLQQPNVRVEYPLEHGFPNDLFNRYHPRLAIQTKAILYYDDDGPFYSYQAIVGGFELWKRNSNAQIGAMARKLDFSPRQLNEQEVVSQNGPADRFFISYCPTDQIRYNYNEFAQFGAKMVLPSGSFLHSNYLPCLWHGLFQPLRTYVQEHPVHPDDGTVSMIIAQLSGRAPKVYSRRINNSNNPAADGAKNGRRLYETRATTTTTTMMKGEKTSFESYHHNNSIVLDRRRLMDGINWDAPGAHAQKMDWGKLRSDVANSLARYFGSVNSGSLGWCYGTEYQRGQSCDPDQAKVGMIPWLNVDHTARTTCP